jgi:uncharacterized protein YbjT (DUF2867 family)
MSKTVLITGATGKQGGAVIDVLLQSSQAKDFTILAVTRNPEGGAAQKLKSKGVKIVKGDLNDVPALFKEAKQTVTGPIWGVFSVQVPMGKGASVETEEAQGKALVDGALANNVKTFVYSSVDRGGDEKSFSNPTPIPHFISKHNIERHLVEKAGAQGERMNWTILRPVAFMDNFTSGFMGKGFATMWKVALKEKPLQLISVYDIGYFAAQAFINSKSYNARGISLAGDSLSFEEAAKVFKEKMGKEMPTTYDLMAKGMLWAVGDLGTMFQWFATDGYGADIQMLRKEHPDLMGFGHWLVTMSEYKSAAQ